MRRRKAPTCKKCNDFGAYQACTGGRVHRVYCDCEAGERFRKRAAGEE